MMRYEILDSANNVINTIVADQQFVDAAYPGRWRAAAQSDAPPVTPALRHISVGAFYDRFGAAKYAILADSSAITQALIRDTSVRQYIDLDRADLPAALQMLIDAGHGIDAGAILSAPIMPGELP
ncbi:hypothetical protein [Thauera butanivorans]|uniref:hypothetical protein n=1 Tax=Thauera butanivorans TaxID=86174 RepID=UPI000837BD3D|nr:hypothetical protein [Thauera butanivorans]